MHDAISCSELGIPSMVVVSSPFESLAKLTASKFGLPQFPIQLIEHPVFTRDDAWMSATAGRIADNLIQALTLG